MLARAQLEMQAADRKVQRVEGGETVRIVRDAQVQFFDHLGGNPPGAGLEARERMLVEHQAVNVVLHQAPGAGCPGRAAANNEDFCF